MNITIWFRGIQDLRRSLGLHFVGPNEVGVVSGKEVQVGNDQEKAQSERNSLSKNRRGKN